MALSAAAHHSFDKVAAGERNDGPRAQKTDRAGEAAHKAPRRQRSNAAGDAVFFELFDEDTAGMRLGVLAEPWPQEQVQRHTMEHIVDFVCCAPLVQTLDAPVSQTVEQLQDVLQFFDSLSTVPERVLEVPKIFTEDVPMRAVLRDTQLAQQLVEVPTIISNPLLLLLQALQEHKQRTVEQNVDTPAVGGSGAGGGLSGFLPGQNYSMVVLEIFKVYPVDRTPLRLLRILLDKLAKGFFALFPNGEKVRRSRAPRSRNWVPSRAHGRREPRQWSLWWHNMVCGVFSLLLRGRKHHFFLWFTLLPSGLEQPLV